MTDPLLIAGTALSSRLLVGTAGYPNQQVLLDCLEASGAEIVTVSIRRISLEGYAESSSRAARRALPAAAEHCRLRYGARRRSDR